MYIEIDGQRYPCEVQSSKTQCGKPMIRIISEAPIATDGFTLINDNGKEYDRSDYKYLYREDGVIKEYSTEAEEILEAHGYISGVPTSPIERQISALNQRVSAITPYTMSKEVYIGNTECVFDKAKDGNISAWLTVGNEQIPCSYEVVNDMIVVSFEALEEVGTVNISIQ